MTLREIAEAMGVSPASISIVRQGREGVSARTRRKIQLKLEENGYTYVEYRPPSQFAQRPDGESAAQQYIQLLKYRKSSLLIDKNEGFVDAIIDSIDAQASAEGYALLVKSVTSEEYAGFLQAPLPEPLTGLLVIATEMDREDICALEGIRAPLVIMDSDHPNLPFSTVTMNNRDLAYEAVHHLVARGSGRVGYLASSIRTGNFVGRENGFFEAVKRHGKTACEADVFSVTPSLQGAYDDMRAHLAAGRRAPDALFADNDVLAIGAMRALQEAGYRVPEDVRVIGVDNTPLSQIASPSLSTMQISRLALGQQAFQALVRQAAFPEGETLHIRIGSRLIQRETT